MQHGCSNGAIMLLLWHLLQGTVEAVAAWAVESTGPLAWSSDTVPLSPFSSSVLSPPCRYHCQSLSNCRFSLAFLNWIFAHCQRHTLLFLSLSLPFAFLIRASSSSACLCGSAMRSTAKSPLSHRPLLEHTQRQGSCSFSVLYCHLVWARLQSPSKCHPLSIAAPLLLSIFSCLISQSVNPM